MIEPIHHKQEKRRIVLGVCGSIAAYKAAELARRIVSVGNELRCVMTPAGQEFLGAKTLEAISGAPVVTGFWDGSEGGSITHIQLADWAECLVIAPATADTIAKLAYGFAESPLLAVALATKAPLVVAPAMNCHMWEHAATRTNIETLRVRGASIVRPGSGMLACGWEGTGRLAEFEDIELAIEQALTGQSMRNLKVLIAAGPTREPIDPVRYISNRSSGKMGLALARQAVVRGATVSLVHGPIEGIVPRTVASTKVTTAQEMLEALSRTISEEGPWDVIVMAAAVADFRPRHSASSKIKSSKDLPAIELQANPDILSTICKESRGSGKPFVIGFAVETGTEDQLIEEARSKLIRKGADMIVANFAADGFEGDTNRVWVVSGEGQVRELASDTKDSIAGQICELAIIARAGEKG